MAVERRWLAGVAAAVLVSSGCSETSEVPAPPPPSFTSSSFISGTADINSATEDRTVSSEPTAALKSFLQAEVDGDFERSFQYLAASDQEAAGGVGGWTADHLFVLPTIVDYSISGHLTEASRSEVAAELTLRPGLDQLTGLTTSLADSAWVLMKEDSGWRVALTQSNIEPVYLDEETAPHAVERWVEQRRACATAVQWNQALLGYPALAEDLCGFPGAVAIGEPKPLSDAVDAAPFLAAFGPEVGVWARVVAVDSPAPLRVVVAPIGEHWLVIGVLAASTS